MSRLLGGIPLDRFVVVHAAPAESPWSNHERVFELGVGKVAATASLYALLLAQESRQPPAAVLLCGLAGAYPDRLRETVAPVRRGQVCIVGSDQLADEGVETPAGFVDFGAPVFGHRQRLVDTGPFPASPRLAADASTRLSVPMVRGATVSTCSGTDATAKNLHRRTRADIETMEGAAVAAVCRRREVPLLHVRAISNWTGDRDRGEWNIGDAVDVLRRAIQRLLQPDD